MSDNMIYVFQPPTMTPLVSQFVGSILAHEQTAGLNSMTDIYIASDEPVVARRGAREWIRVVKENGTPWVFSDESIRAFINGIYLGEEKRLRGGAWEAALRRTGSLNPATVLGGEINGETIAIRVRCSIQRQSMGTGLGLVVRVLTQRPPGILELGLPFQLDSMVGQITNGLIVVTGPTGSGKSTTLASLISSIRSRQHVHVLTIEDPIEYEFDTEEMGVVTQREIHVDCPSFAQGVKDALRFVPDVIMVGETRDSETMRAVVRAAESGHLVMTSMHAPTVLGAISKMRALLADNQADINALASSLRLIIAQALVRGTNGSNELVYEMVPIHDRIIQQYVISGSQQDAESIRGKLLSRQIPGAVTWQERLRFLVREGKMEKERAAMLALSPEERKDFLS